MNKTEAQAQRIALHHEAVLFHLAEHMPEGIIADYRTCPHISCQERKAKVDACKDIEMGIVPEGAAA